MKDAFTLSKTDSTPAAPRAPAPPPAAVHLQGWGTAVPAFAVSQANALAFILANFDIRPATQNLYRRTLSNPVIEKRHFAVESLADVLDTDRDRINQRFERESAALATRSLLAALAAADCRGSDIDFLVSTTCTGYLCPGISAHLVESCGLRRDVRLVDAVGMGCGAALPALQQARDAALAHPGAVTAVVCTEICSAAMFSNDAADIVISNTIFADGSAAAILRAPVGSASNGRSDGVAPRLLDFESLMVPEWRESLRFRTRDGYLMNVLGKDVPRQAAEALRLVVERLLARNGRSAPDVDHWVLHAGGDAVLNAAEETLSLPPHALRSGRAVLRNFGNMSSPTVLFVLDEEMRSNLPAPGAVGVLASFGAGFSVHAVLVEFG